MIRPLVIASLILCFGLVLIPSVRSAEQAKINEAIKKGGEYLKRRNQDFGLDRGLSIPEKFRMGAMALSGMAMMESGIPRDDPVLKKMLEQIRGNAYTDKQTYDVLGVFGVFGRYGDQNDVPLIQLLGLRLYAGMNAAGGWSYECPEWTAAEIARFQELGKGDNKPNDSGKKERPKNGKPPKIEHDVDPTKLHPEVQQYLQTVTSQSRQAGPGDNSNTQFGLIGLWVAARHQIPVNDAFTLIDDRFMGSQNQKDGGWGYDKVNSGSTLSMTCAGLLGLAVGAANAMPQTTTKKPKPEPKVDPNVNPDDPFYNPKKPPVDPKPVKPVHDARHEAIEAGLVLLGKELNKPNIDDFTYYSIWSIERVAMAYGLDMINNVDWHDRCGKFLMAKQEKDGSWKGEWGVLVSTSLSVLFLSRSNYVPDLTDKISPRMKDLKGAELRATRGKKPFSGNEDEKDKKPDEGAEKPKVEKPAPPKDPALPKIGEVDATADALVSASGDEWTVRLKEIRDAKGSDKTLGMAHAIPRLDDERRDQAREALGQRLTRMTAATLRTLMKDPNVELRRAACLACAMKDEKAHIPDLIDKLIDESNTVVRAAHAGLKSLTGQDFGPPGDADDFAKSKAKADWKKWYESQDKK